MTTIAMKTFQRTASLVNENTFACTTPRYTASRCTISRRGIATGGTYRIPKAFNEKNHDFLPGSEERKKLAKALSSLKERLPVTVPPFQGRRSNNSATTKTIIPSESARTFATYTPVTKQDISEAIESALLAKQSWQDTPFHDRAAIFLRAADLASGKYRFELLAATMLGQGKNAWQAEIDAGAELADFYRFNVSIAQDIYDRQPTVVENGQSARTDWRPLEGFVYAVSPFNFTAIGGNLISAPALMGNVVVWKPSPANVYASYLVHKILLEAGLPPNVIQFVNGDPEMITDTVMDHSEFSAFNFVGSSDVFRSLFTKVGEGVAKRKYRDFPRMIAETSGKNFHMIHASADIPNAVNHTIRATFEYAGQKCSACSRIYLPESRAKEFLSLMKTRMQDVKVGDPEDFTNFLGPVINQAAFDKITKFIDEANKDSNLETVFGGTYDDSKGLYITPTAYISKVLDHALFNTELFGPILGIYVYPDAEYESTLSAADKQGGGFALTGAVFAQDLSAIQKAEHILRYSAGNFYTNCKCTGAVVGQQPFGGARGSGTNDKAGSIGTLMRFVSPRTLKEDFGKLHKVLYPSNQ